MARPLLFLILGLTVGGAFAWWQVAPDSESSAAAGDPQRPGGSAAGFAELEARIAALEAQLATEAALAPDLSRVAIDPRTDEPGSVTPSVAAASASTDIDMPPDRNSRMRRFLTRRGLADNEIDAVIAFESRRRLANLDSDWEQRREAYLAGELDTATENGYFDELRAAIGDDTFERYMAAVGRGLGISAIIPGTAAEYAGIQTGDIIRSYNGERVFTSAHLNTLTVQGERGESVSIEVVRDGEVVAVTIPRGPIGVETGGRQRLRRP